MRRAHADCPEAVALEKELSVAARKTSEVQFLIFGKYVKA